MIEHLPAWKTDQELGFPMETGLKILITARSTSILYNILSRYLASTYKHM